MQLILVICSIAVCVAFAALWMSSAAIKKTEHQLAEFGNVVRHDFGGLRGEVEASLADMQARGNRAEQRVEQSKEAEATMQKGIDELKGDIAMLRDVITELEASIPPQYRRRKHMTDQDQVQN